MVKPEADEPGGDSGLVRRAAGGDAAALADLFGRHRDRLRRMVSLRIDRRLQGRVSPSDVLQDAFLDLSRQLPEYAAREDGGMPVFLWMRLVTGQRLLRVHRQHVGAAMRDAGREASIHGGAPEAGSEALSDCLVGRLTTASQAAIREEQRRRLQGVLEGMDSVDREVIALRHFEELTNGETAAVLGLSKAAASNRYVRALARLQATIEATPGFLDPPGP